jgi:preprotein translocase subunit SecG
MTIFLIVVHVIACVALIGIVLIQRGRGGGLVESFSNVESMFGPKTSAFLTKTTSILSVVFFFTCLSLAIFSVKQSRSLMRGAARPINKAVPAAPLAPAAQATQAKEAVAPEAVKQEVPVQEQVKEEAPKETAKP